MTRNFSILEDYKVSKNQEDIKERIEKIETLISKKDFNYIYIEGRCILELILSNDYEDISNLNKTIQDLILRRIIPTKVKNALYSIKSKGNDGAHAVDKPSNIPFVIKIDIFSAVEFLKQLFIVIKFFAKECNNDSWTEKDDKEYSFNSDIYLPNKYTNDTQEIDEITDVSSDTDLKTKLTSIFELISSDFQFLIPTYQRAYTWTKDNVNVFLQDIMDRTKDKKSHYMGSLAMAIDSEKKILRLIDGQQRITTCLLLLRSIINRFIKIKNLEMPKELEFIKDKLSFKYINLGSSYNSISYIKKILDNDLIVSDVNFKKSCAYENFIHINEYLDKLNDEDFDEFYTSFFSNFIISEIKFTHEIDKEIQIFENLNSKGTELSQWDLIKNYIYKKVSLDFLILNEKRIDEMLNELFVFKASKHFGNKKKWNELSKFFILYCRIESKINKNIVLSDKGKIHKIFSDLWPKTDIKFNNMENLRWSLLEVAKLFEIYGILASKNYLNNDSKLFEFKLHLENLSAKDAHFPLIINAIKENIEWNNVTIKKIHEKNKFKLLKFIADIDKYITRLIVVNNVGQSLPQFFDYCISKDIEQSHRKFIDSILVKGKQSSLPSHKEFEKIIKTKNDWQAFYAMSVLRTISWNDNSFNSKKYHIFLKPSLEHIFPQTSKFDSSWFKESNLSWNKFEEKISTKINKLGNYLIMASTQNSKVKNKNFIEKLETYKSFAEDKLLSGNFESNQIMNLLLKNSFTMEDIDERTKQIALIVSPLYKLSFEK